MFNNIARVIKENRYKAGITQSNMAIALGLKNGQFISNIERGRCSLPAKNINKAAKLLKINRKLIVDAMVEDFKESLK